MRPTFAAALVLIAIAPVPIPSRAGDDAPKPQPPADFVLFDGQGLDGWKPTDFGGQGAVKVEGGAIVMEAGRPMTGITSTRSDLPRTDYDLQFEARRVEGGDFFAAATFPVGESYITLVNGGWGGHVTGLSSIDGADASENETGIPYTYEPGRWYRFQVRVTDGAIRCWIDEKLVVGIRIVDREIKTRLETRANQPLGFATWMTTGAVRGIEVRRLTPAAVAENNAYEQ